MRPKAHLCHLNGIPEPFAKRLFDFLGYRQVTTLFSFPDDHSTRGQYAGHPGL
jgi:hypothetical protein